MSLGALNVRLGLDAAEFTAGLTKSEYQARNFAQQVKSSFVGNLGASLFEQLSRDLLRIPGALLDNIAGFKGLSEQIGATGAEVASLKSAADISGVALDSVAKGSVKLTSALAQSGESSKAAAAALAAINIPIEEFRNLDPVTQLERVALQLAKFEDGAGKTAVAVQLFGKAGAELIPFFNDLAAAGGRQLRLTDEQIEAADKYTKQIAGLKSELQALSQGIIADVLPTFSKLLDTINAIRKGSVFGWLTTSGAEAADPGKRIAEIDESLKKLKKTRDELNAVGGAAGWFNKFGVGGSDVSIVEKQIAALEKQRAYLKEVKTANDLKSIEGIGDLDPMPPQQRLNFQLKDSDKKSTAKISDAERYLKSLERTYEAAQELTHYEQLMWDVQQGRLGAVTPKQLEYAVSLTKSLDAQKAAGIEAEKQAALDDLITKALERSNAEQERMNKHLQSQADSWLDLADPMRKFIRDLEEIDGLVSKGFLTGDQAKMIRQNMGDRTEKGTDELGQYAINAARSMQSAFADFLFDPFKDGLDGMLANFGKIIQRMIAEAAAAQLMKALFGDDPTKWFSRFLGGGGAGNFGAAAGEATPFAVGTNYVPYDGMPAVLHRGEAVVPAKYNPAAGGMGGSPTVIQNITVNGGASKADMVMAARESKDQAVAEILRMQRRS